METANRAVSCREKTARCIARRPRHRFVGPALLFAAMSLLAPTRATAQTAVSQGVWLIEKKAAVRIYDCKGLMCGQIVWLYKPLNPQGQLDRDKFNPNLALRQRQLCGLTMLWDLRPAGLNRWKNGWFYNPDDGHTYRVSAQLTSDNVMVARIYEGIALFGQNRTLVRIPHEATAGWC